LRGFFLISVAVEGGSAVTGYTLGIGKACLAFEVRVLMFSFNLSRRWAGRDRRKYYWDGGLG